MSNCFLLFIFFGAKIKKENLLINLILITMSTQMRIEKKRLNSEIKQYIKCIKRFKKANAHKENIKRLENYLLSLETRKNNLKK